MGVITCCVIGGIMLGTWVAGKIISDNVSKEQAQAEIAKIDIAISNNKTIKQNFIDLKSKLNNGKSYLDTAKKDFTNGGHVLDGVPLANSEFKSCINKINDAVKDIDGIVSDIDETIAELNKSRKEWQSKL